MSSRSISPINALRATKSAFAVRNILPGTTAT